MTINGYTLIPHSPQWANSVGWSRKWQTDIETTLSGGENRSQMTKSPILGLSYTVILGSLVEAQQFENWSRDALKSGAAAIPYWGRGIKLAANSGTNTINVGSSPYVPAVGDWLYLWIDYDKFDAVQVATVAGSVVTFSSSLSTVYQAGAYAWPILFGRASIGSVNQITHQAFSAEINFVEQDPDGLTKVGSLGGHSPTTFPTLGGYRVLTIDPSWNEDKVKQHTYNLNELTIGYGAESFTPTETDLVRGFELQIDCFNQAELIALDDFTVAAAGRSNSFWVMDSRLAFEIVAGVSSASFKIKAIGYQVPPTGFGWVAFSKGASLVFAQVATVTINGDGTETIGVTLDTTGSFDQTWTAYRLYLCRNAEDTEKGIFYGEWAQQRSIRLVSMSDTALTQFAPVWVYHFYSKTTPQSDWWVTSNALNVTSGGQFCLSASIDHGPISRNIRGDGEDVTLTGFLPDVPALSYFIPIVPSWQLCCEIYEDTINLDNRRLRYTGTVRSVSFNGKKFTAKVSAFGAELDRKVPTYFIQPRCNAVVFDSKCGLSRAAFAKTGIVTGVGDNYLLVKVNSFTTSFPDYWTGGDVVFGTGTGTEIRSIVKSSLNSVVGADSYFDIWMSSKIPAVLPGSSTVSISPGCDGRLVQSCRAKYSNELNFRGTPYVPTKNPTLKGFATKIGGGKK